MVAGDGKGEPDSIDEHGELGGWLESGVVGGVNILGLFLICWIHFLHTQRSQQKQNPINPATITKERAMVSGSIKIVWKNKSGGQTKESTLYKLWKIELKIEIILNY